MTLNPDMLDPDPITQFTRWFLDAEQAELPLHNAMTLATADRQGRPSARIVLLRWMQKGLYFTLTIQVENQKK